MLILICGPSGSGKSSVRNGLVKDFGWKSIIWLTTRQQRSLDEGGEDKKNISVSEFEKIQKKGDFFCIFSYHGNQYGIEKEFICRALSSPSQKWCLDFPPEKLHCFSSIEDQIICIFIMPGNKHELQARLSKSNRTYRISQSLKELKLVRAKYLNALITDYVVINNENHLKETINEISGLDFDDLLLKKSQRYSFSK